MHIAYNTHVSNVKYCILERGLRFDSARVMLKQVENIGLALG